MKPESFQAMGLNEFSSHRPTLGSCVSNIFPMMRAKVVLPHPDGNAVYSHTTRFLLNLRFDRGKYDVLFLLIVENCIKQATSDA